MVNIKRVLETNFKSSYNVSDNAGCFAGFLMRLGGPVTFHKIIPINWTYPWL